jgi:hypothetical protein
LIFIHTYIIKGLALLPRGEIMDAAQTSHEKRTINVKDFLQDFHSGLSDQHLLKKYNLTESGLETFYQMLEDRGILEPDQLRTRQCGPDQRAQVPLDLSEERSSYICPRCLASHETMFDICPSCGVSFHELISQDKGITAAPPKDDENRKIRDRSFGDEEVGEHRAVETDLHSPLISKNPSTDPTEDFFDDDRIPKFPSFEDSLEEIVSGAPLEPSSTEVHSSPASCASCECETEPGIRNIYDRKMALQALTFAGVSFVIGFLGIVALSLFEGQSLARLVVFFCTVAAMLVGVILATTGAFLLLAREKVYICPACHRAYPRI